MRRILVALIVLTSFAAGVPRAEAYHGTCGGEVDLVSSQPVYSFPFPTVASFEFVSTPATVCNNGLVLSGSITLGCGPAQGVGTWNGHSYLYTNFGPTVVFSGGVVGAFVLVPAPGQSCLTGITRFLAVGGVSFAL